MHGKILLVTASLVCSSIANLWDDIVDGFYNRHLNSRDDVVAHVSVWSQALSASELANKRGEKQLVVHRGACTKVPHFKKGGTQIERYRIVGEWDATWSPLDAPLSRCTLMLYEEDGCKMSDEDDRGYSMGSFSDIAWGATWGPWDRKKHCRDHVQQFVTPVQAFRQIAPGVDIFPKSMGVICRRYQDWDHEGWTTAEQIGQWQT